MAAYRGRPEPPQTSIGVPSWGDIIQTAEEAWKSQMRSRDADIERSREQLVELQQQLGETTPSTLGSCKGHYFANALLFIVVPQHTPCRGPPRGVCSL